MNSKFQLDNLFKINKSRLALRNWNIPQFYVEAIGDFQKLNASKVATATDVKETIVWYNDDILINNQPVFNKSMYRAGIKSIGNLLGPNGTS